MARKKKRRKPAASPAPPTLKIPSPLQVQVVPSPKPKPDQALYFRRWGLWTVAFLLFSTSGWLWYVYLFPQAAASQVDCTAAVPGLRVSVTYPVYLAIGDEGEMHVTITNEISNTQPITGAVLIEFQGPGAIRLAPQVSNTVDFEGLSPGEQQSATIRFAFNEPAALIANSRQPLNFALRVAGSPQTCVPGPWRISVAPIYRLRAMLTTLWGSATIATLTGLLWNRIQNWIGYD